MKVAHLSFKAQLKCSMKVCIWFFSQRTKIINYLYLVEILKKLKTWALFVRRLGLLQWHYPLKVCLFVLSSFTFGKSFASGTNLYLFSRSSISWNTNCQKYSLMIFWISLVTMVTCIFLCSLTWYFCLFVKLGQESVNLV